MTKQQNAESLARINAYRAASGLDPLKDFRPARHQKFLDEIVVPWEAMIAAEEAEKATAVAKEEGDDLPEAAKTESYKHLARKAPAKSGVVSPVAFVHSFLDANPGLKRKQAMAALIAEGVNFSTARTQYQKWFAARKA